MPRIIDYSIVLERMTQEGFVSLYYNSGAFGFPPGVTPKIVGLVGPDDPSIREALRPSIVQVSPPYQSNLARTLKETWQKELPGTLWLMPKSHWAYELDFGNREWLPEALASIGIDPTTLQKLTNATAIEFDVDESDALARFTESLFTHLQGSDFSAAFPGRQAICTLHHHKQIWWQTTQAWHGRLAHAV